MQTKEIFRRLRDLLVGQKLKEAYSYQPPNKPTIRATTLVSSTLKIHSRWNHINAFSLQPLLPCLVGKDDGDEVQKYLKPSIRAGVPNPRGHRSGRWARAEVEHAHMHSKWSCSHPLSHPTPTHKARKLGELWVSEWLLDLVPIIFCFPPRIGGKTFGFFIVTHYFKSSLGEGLGGS